MLIWEKVSYRSCAACCSGSAVLGEAAGDADVVGGALGGAVALRRGDGPVAG